MIDAGRRLRLFAGPAWPAYSAVGVGVSLGLALAAHESGVHGLLCFGLALRTVAGGWTWVLPGGALLAAPFTAPGGELRVNGACSSSGGDCLGWRCFVHVSSGRSLSSPHRNYRQKGAGCQVVLTGISGKGTFWAVSRLVAGKGARSSEKQAVWRRVGRQGSAVYSAGGRPASRVVLVC